MKNSKRKRSFWKTLLLFLFMIASLSCGLILGYIGGLVKDQPVLSQEEMNEQIKDISQNSEVYFGTGEKLGTINSELIRKAINYDEMGDNVKNAIIASEDANFYSNNGVEPLAILRATYSELRNKATTGGSTITQQLVKNQLLDNSRSYERKAKEILLALRVDNNFSKHEILETYLNIAPFGKNSLGQNISGIETAAQGVFGIHAKELNIAQAAYLIGFVQSPYKYTPFDANGDVRSKEDLEKGFYRQRYVLDRMLSTGYITNDEYNKALSFDIQASFKKLVNNEYIDYPYIRDEVVTSAAEILAEQTALKNGNADRFKQDASYKNELIEQSRIKFITGGYKVKTTINKALYDKLQSAKENFKSLPIAYNNGVAYPMEIGASIVENNSGKILAFIGGMDYKKQQLNHATRTYRSPGSTIKPILVYGPAMDKGYITPNSTVLDKRFNYLGWTPENFAKVEYGTIPAKQALAMSLNLSTIRLYSAFSNENPVGSYLEKMNFKKLTDADKDNLSPAIGGFANGISVTENTNAFATLANGGQFKQAYIIEEIRNHKNEIVYRANFKPVQVYSKETSYLIVNMLNEVINASYGTARDIGSGLKFNNKNLFVKTGTAEFNNDLWVVGGSTNITMGLWTGYDKPTSISGYDAAHKQWTYFMNVLYDFDKNLVAPDKAFSKPDSIVSSSINPYNNGKGSVSDLVPKDFKQLDSLKTSQKFGSNIDKFTDYTFKPIIKKDSSKKDDDKKDEDKKDTDKKTDSDGTYRIVIGQDD